jgi:hypothetical protein
MSRNGRIIVEILAGLRAAVRRKGLPKTRGDRGHGHIHGSRGRGEKKFGSEEWWTTL